MKNIILKNGIYGGLIVSLVMAGMTLYMKSYPDYEPNMLIGFGSMLLAFCFVILGIITIFKNKEINWTNFFKAIGVGILISLIISTIYVVVWLVIYYNFFPNFMDQYGAMVLKNSKPNEIAAKTAEINQMKEWYKSPIMIILLTFMEIFPFGIAVSVLTSTVFFVVKHAQKK